MSVWQLAYDGYDPAEERLREALCTVGNGFFATRGAAPESDADDHHYPGTYVGGLFNRLSTEIAGQTVTNEDLVNLPNWLPLTFRVDGADWFDIDAVEVLDYRQTLDVAAGVLTRHVRYADPSGRLTTVDQRRLVSMAEPHVAALETRITADNWSGRLTVRSGLDGRVTNGLVGRYQDLPTHHLDTLDAAAVDDETIWLKVRTNQSRVEVAEAARTRVWRDGVPVGDRVVDDQGDRIAHELSLDVAEGQTTVVEKVVSLYTSRDWAVSECGEDACRTLRYAGSFDELLRPHQLAWDQLWRRCRLEIGGHGRAQLVLNVHIFHLLVTVSENSIDRDVGVPARGLHGEAYRGHIFWDELFIFPFLILRLPELTRELLRYRARRLPEARRAARDAGHEGAMYPWQSGSSGAEESQRLHLNPRSGRWMPDNSRLQRHINVAVAYNVWQYYEVTGDVEFLAFYGGEMLMEIARFLGSVAHLDPDDGRYHIRDVLGPDEYHDGYPDSDKPGLDDNAYTNVMAVWVLCRALDVLQRLPVDRAAQLRQRLALGDDLLAHWDDVSRRMYVPFHGDGIISQFEGYDRLEEFDWSGYRRRYGDIQRLDRILEAEDDTPNRYQVSKQADVLMLLYLLTPDELAELFARLGYPFEPATAIPRTVEYYQARTSHGSTLSRVVHSWVLARSDRARSWQLFAEALESDISDIQDGTTPEGIHLGAMAGTVDLVQRAYTGLQTIEDDLWFDPALPDELDHLEFDIRYRHHWSLTVRIDHASMRVAASPAAVAPVTIRLRGQPHEIAAGETCELAL